MTHPQHYQSNLHKPHRIAPSSKREIEHENSTADPKLNLFRLVFKTALRNNLRRTPYTYIYHSTHNELSGQASSQIHTHKVHPPPYKERSHIIFGIPSCLCYSTLTRSKKRPFLRGFFLSALCFKHNYHSYHTPQISQPDSDFPLLVNLHPFIHCMPYPPYDSIQIMCRGIPYHINYHHSLISFHTNLNNRRK